MESQLRNRPRATQPKKGKDSGTGAGRQHWSIGAWSFSARVRVLEEVPVRKPASACSAGGNFEAVETARPPYLALYVDGTGPGGARCPFSHALAGEMTNTFPRTCTRTENGRRPDLRARLPIAPPSAPARRPACLFGPTRAPPPASSPPARPARPHRPDPPGLPAPPSGPGCAPFGLRDLREMAAAGPGPTAGPCPLCYHAPRARREVDRRFRTLSAGPAASRLAA